MGKTLQSLSAKSACAVAICLASSGCGYNFKGMFSKQAAPGAVSYGVLVPANSADNHQTSAKGRASTPTKMVWSPISTAGPELFNKFVALGATWTTKVSLKDLGQLPVSDFTFSIYPIEMAQNYSVTSDCTRLDALGEGSAPSDGTHDICTATITFNPQILQTVDANLVASYNDSKGHAGQSFLPMSGLSAAIPFYSFEGNTPSSVTNEAIFDFSSVIIGQPVTKEIHLKFNGDLPGAIIDGKQQIPTAALANDPNTGFAPKKVFDPAASLPATVFGRALSSGETGNPFTVSTGAASGPDCNLDGPGGKQDSGCWVKVTYTPTVDTLGKYDWVKLTFAYNQWSTDVIIKGQGTPIKPMILGVGSVTERDAQGGVGSPVGPNPANHYAFKTVVRNPKTPPGNLIYTFGAFNAGVANWDAGTQDGIITKAVLQTTGGGAMDPRLKVVSDTCTGATLKKTGTGSTCVIEVSFNTTSTTNLTPLTNQEIAISYTSSDGVKQVPKSFTTFVEGKTVHPPTFTGTPLVIASPTPLPDNETTSATLTYSINDPDTSGIAPLAVSCAPAPMPSPAPEITVPGCDPSGSTPAPALGHNLGANQTLTNIGFAPKTSSSTRTTYSSTYVFTFDDGTADDGTNGTIKNPSQHNVVVTAFGSNKLVISDTAQQPPTPLTTSITTTPVNFGNMLYDGAVHGPNKVPFFIYGSQGLASMSGSALSTADGALSYGGASATFPGTSADTNPSICVTGASSAGRCFVPYQVKAKPQPATAPTEGADIVIPNPLNVTYTPAGGTAASIAITATGKFWTAPYLQVGYNFPQVVGANPTGTSAYADFSLTTPNLVGVTYDSGTKIAQLGSGAAGDTEEFGTVLLNDLATHKYTLTALARSASNPMPLTITSVSIKGANSRFSIVQPLNASGAMCNGGTSLAVNSNNPSSCTFGVQFAPKVVNNVADSGDISDTLVVVYTDGIATRTYNQPLHGKADSANAYLAYNNKTLSGATGTGISFPSAVDGVQSISAAVKIDYKAGSLSLPTASVTGTGFKVSAKSDCSGSGTSAISCINNAWGPGASCSFFVCYTNTLASPPPASPPSNTGTLTINYTAATSYASNTLPGTNVAATQTVNLSATLNRKVLTVAAPNPVPTFTPSAVFVGYSSSGAPKATWNFSVTGAGTVTTPAVSVQNSGNYTASINTNGCTGTFPCTISVDVQMKQGLTAGASGTTTYGTGNVTLSFNDGYGVSKSASASASADVNELTAKVAATSGGSPISTWSASYNQNQTVSSPPVITFTNTGPQAATVVGAGLGAAITGTGASAFKPISGNTCASLGGGTLPASGSNSCQLTINPDTSVAVGSYSASLTFTYQYTDSTAAVKTSVITIPLSLTVGQNVPNVVLNAAPSSTDFGRVLVGSSSSAIQLVLKNTGTAAAATTIIGVSTGSYPTTALSSPFVVDGSSSCGGSLAVNATCSYNIVFTPSATALGSSTVKIGFGYTDAGGAQKISASTVTLTGMAVLPIKVFAGGSTTCITDHLGQARCWGDNSGGQTAAASASQTFVSASNVNGINFGSLGSGVTVKKIAVGLEHACAILKGGNITTNNVYCWGNNAYGQLGQGNVNTFTTPQVVSLGAAALDIAAGIQHTCAVLTTGAVKCWGYNNAGQIGIDSNAQQNTPVAAKLSSNASAVFASSLSTCAVLNSGALQCWGDNFGWNLGISDPAGATSTIVKATVGSASSASNLPMSQDPTINLGSNVTASYVGMGGEADFSCVLTNLNDVRCYGETAYPYGVAQPFTIGILGDSGSHFTAGTDRYNGMGSKLTPVVLGNSSTASLLAVGGSHVCVVVPSGTVRCWGNNTNGQLGNGGTTVFTGNASGDMTSLGDVVGVNGSGALGNVLTTAGGSSLAAGASHTCAVNSSNGVYCWGSSIGAGTASTGTALASPVLVFDGAAR